jgi:uncharacterized radical SAM superfamily Fe-S cluster-containing enzyme
MVKRTHFQGQDSTRKRALDNNSGTYDIIKETTSICPECLEVVSAIIHKKDEQVLITKTCSTHGEYTDVYWSDYNLYMKAKEYERKGVTLENPQTKELDGCPNDCGICPNHKSSTTLGIIDITNRCNMRCPICFAHSGAAGYLYEPTKEQIKKMMEKLLDNKPIWTPALQLSGGEPTVREDLPQLVEMALDLGFVHVEVNTNGIKMAESVEYCRKLKDAGVSTVYLQFDSITPEPYIIARGFDLLEIKKRAILNLKRAGFRSIVLVPVLVNGVNDHQVGDIIKFAINNKDCIRAVNFQPVSITGRINKKLREEMRITIPDLIKGVEEQTDGLIKQQDWYPVPFVEPLCQFLSTVKEEPFVDFSSHPHCGMGTYLYIDDKDEVHPITRLMDVESLLESLEKASKKLNKGKKTRGKMEIFFSVLKNVKFKALHDFMSNIILRSDYLSLNRMHHNMILISTMHFQDPYNFDIERIQKCVIHYATPEEKLIPFCTMNTLHRQKIERKFAKKIDTKVDSIYDVEKLTKRILEEEKEELRQSIKIKDMPEAKPLKNISYQPK